MRILDLFSGLGGWSAPFTERGHEIVTVDNQERFAPTVVADVLSWEPEANFDVVLASPPCEKFSVMTIGKAWLPGYVPRHDGTRLAIRLVERTVELIEQIRPSFWVVENPVGMLRKLNLLPYERRWVTYCRYGGHTRKPSDLWGGFPPSLTLRATCRNYDRCHVSSPRGSTTGIQGDGGPKIRDGTRTEMRDWGWGATTASNSPERRDAAALRAKIPAQLALDVCLAAERDLAAGHRAADYTGRLFA